MNLKINNRMNITRLFVILFSFGNIAAFAQNPNMNYNKFKQLHEEFSTPNVFRSASGAPGHEYYQNNANYVIELELDEDSQTITGKETITYVNNSPDPLEYLWVQLDQNIRAKDSDTKKIASFSIADTLSDERKKRALTYFNQRLESDFDGGFKIDKVSTENDQSQSYTINKTMMRINLEEPLASGKSFTFKVEWHYLINDRMQIGGRSGYESFPDGNSLYTIAQFFPRMAVYDDVEGWQNKQFLGNGEFALPFGDYDVKITVPADHIVGATGVLQNAEEVLSEEHMANFEKAINADEPTIIISEEFARENEKGRSKEKKTWHYKAEMVRDFAFASSRKFIWDAMGVEMSDGRRVIATSLYPKEGNPLWEKYSTWAVAQTLETYSEKTFDYPYPIAYSVSAESIGMEYPMICFNFGRVDENGEYSDRVRNGMIGVIIHEVGHNYFPMIVNSDERQWTWMDEGLNSFLQYLTEQEFANQSYAVDVYNGVFPSRRGPAKNIIDYMKGDKKYISPIMTNSESIFQFGNNAYGKPATALNILRTAVMGEELFDHAFKTYAQRWMFKHPRPEDFFRTMEDASAFDLDWFWRGWFYTTDHVDINVTSLEKINVDITAEDNLPMGKHYYQANFENTGGLPMPIHLEFEFEDGTKETKLIPAEIWRYGDQTSKVFTFDKAIKSLKVDPKELTADTNTENNTITVGQKRVNPELSN